MFLGFICVQTCKPVSHSSYQSVHKIIYNKDTYYCQPKKDGILFKLYGMLSPLSCRNFHSCCLKPVYGIVFLQLFEAVADSLTAYYEEAGGGWSQPYNIVPGTLVTSVVSNLPTLTGALSKSKVSPFWQIKIMLLTAGFSVQLFFTWRIFKFSNLYFGIKIRAMLIIVCIFILLVSFSLYSC
jgi:hypothetical protein